MKKIYTLIIIALLFTGCEFEPNVEPNYNKNYFTVLNAYLKEFDEVKQGGYVHRIMDNKYNCPTNCNQVVLGDTIIELNNGFKFITREPMNRTLDSLKVYDINTKEEFYIHKQENE